MGYAVTLPGRTPHMPQILPNQHSRIRFLCYKTSMDPITLGFYAAVCGTLSVVAPRFPRLPIRLAIGVCVGLVAATLLPMLKGMLDIY